MKIKQISHLDLKTTKKLFGNTSNNEVVHLYELTNKNGMRLQLTNFGATVTSLNIPLKNNQTVDVVLGFDTLESYMKSFQLDGAPYFGATVGRYAGRISNGVFNLNGTAVSLYKNNNNHSLHGGNHNFSQKVWEVVKITEGENSSITLNYVSPDGDEHYPGELSVSLTYTLSEKNELIIAYKATTTADTIVNLTHHSYFNLDGHQASLTGQELIINSEKMLETTIESIPTGTILNTAGSVFDFTNPKQCPALIDNTFVIEKTNEYAASLFSKNNKLKMTVYTNQPAVHIYVGGNCLNQIKGKANCDYHSLSGICFETQNFPDAPNHPHFPSAILRKNETYQHKSIYKFQSF
ncbi:aldose epimerase family protein [Flavobacterium muglaense]|uniref:Aldose 1-epimerase n=1 Tax=Flavobacterium muglaense TaxID=2764716 RepID=A0A923MY15_9FLAO|nr:aldose epimerase family protein [Flavobacterium muglaense]MBC5837829.1 galactose mutarotase [Flavobacterium muglaense]MBC5844413.1 galactose mutarotase [Flavobacterium muglaense]